MEVEKLAVGALLLLSRRWAGPGRPGRGRARLGPRPRPGPARPGATKAAGEMGTTGQAPSGCAHTRARVPGRRCVPAAHRTPAPAARGTVHVGGARV